MSALVNDCPRCGTKKITFDVLAAQIVEGVGHLSTAEVFCNCRQCRKTTTFIMADKSNDTRQKLKAAGGITRAQGTLNAYLDVQGYVSTADTAVATPPEHLPEHIDAAFREGAICFAVGCYNAAGTMFRLSLDHATREQIPSTGPQPKPAVKWSLGRRLTWLFENKHLPEALKELSHCIKSDGDDGAHAGTLTKVDAEDLLDFTSAILTRLYTEPKRIALAQLRRDARHQAPPVASSTGGA